MMRGISFNGIPVETENTVAIDNGHVHVVGGPPCYSVSAVIGSTLWATKVRRLARYLASGFKEEPGDFQERKCQHCGLVWYSNIHIHPDDDPFCCGDHRQFTERTTTGFQSNLWYAIAVIGRDPDGNGNGRPGWLRRRALRRECALVRLTFNDPFLGTSDE